MKQVLCGFDSVEMMYRHYGLPVMYWGKGSGLGKFGSMGEKLLEFIKSENKLDGLLIERRGLHLHGPGPLRHPVLPLVCRAMLLTNRPAFYLQADDLATTAPEETPEEFFTDCGMYHVLCVDNINTSKDAVSQPFPWDEDSHFRFERRLMEWLKTEGVLITCGDLPLSDTLLRGHVVRDLCTHAQDLDLTQL